MIPGHLSLSRSAERLLRQAEETEITVIAETDAEAMIVIEETDAIVTTDTDADKL